MFFSQYFSFPCQYHSTIAPYSFFHLHIAITRRTNEQIPGILKKSLSEIRQHWTSNNYHFLFKKYSTGNSEVILQHNDLF